MLGRLYVAARGCGTYLLWGRVCVTMVWPICWQVYGEGIYACFNTGSCVAPDTCYCSDGWIGYDCNTRPC